MISMENLLVFVLVTLWISKINASKIAISNKTGKVTFKQLFQEWNDIIIQNLQLSDSLNPFPLDNIISEARNKDIGCSDATVMKIDALVGKKLSYVRGLKLHGPDVEAFKFAAIPSLSYEFPILGIDIVSASGMIVNLFFDCESRFILLHVAFLGGGNICAIDFQSTIQVEPSYYDSQVYTALRDAYAKYKSLLPEMKGSLPKVYSPFTLIARFAQEECNTYYPIISDIISDYSRIYGQSLQSIDVERIRIESRKQGVEAYINNRLNHDAIRKSLSNAFGSEDWVDEVMIRALFPKDKLLQM
jgi:hypothetical protein